MVDRLNAGEYLALGQSLTSPNGRFTLTLQYDSNFIQTDRRLSWMAPDRSNRDPNSSGAKEFATLFNANSVGTGLYRVLLTSGGDLQLLNDRGQVLHHFETSGVNCRFVCEDNGNITLYNGANAVLWQSLGHLGQLISADGKVVFRGDYVYSATGTYHLKHLVSRFGLLKSITDPTQAPGSGIPIWNSGDMPGPIDSLFVNPAGSLVALGNPYGTSSAVIKSGQKQVFWSSNTPGTPPNGNYLVVGDNGTLKIFSSVGVELWKAF
jgi:hypothetical protein